MAVDGRMRGIMANKYDDFKYVIQDMNYIYFGRELTYGEIMEREDVPFKFKAIINTHIEKDAGLDEKVSGHILRISEQEFSYRIFEQLKMNIRVSYQAQKKNLLGKQSVKWVHKVCPIGKFCGEYREMVKAQKARIEEISISKLALMTISI